MKLSYEIVDLYREIGKEFRRLGAEKVILLKSRTNPDKEEEIFLEKLTRIFSQLFLTITFSYEVGIG